MKIQSLNLRLMLAAVFSTIVALAITAVSISYLFELYFQKRLVDELRADLVQLTAALVIADDGNLEVGALGDPRYEQPFGGRYWQVQIGEALPVFSRSLWDQPLQLSIPDVYGEKQSSFVVAPFGGDLLALSWRISVDGVTIPGGVGVTVATDLAELNAASAQFRRNIILWLALLGLALISAAWLQVRIGLKPLEKIRAELEQVSRDETGKLNSGHPNEVMPLVEAINSLLDRQAANLTNARRRSADLAHGLKTPLTVLAAHADDIRADGDKERADQISGQVASMRFFIERELARSRASSSRRSATNLKNATVEMVNAISRLPDAESINWVVEVPDDIDVPSDAHDLSELLGNLLDNARKYARSKVTIRALKTNNYTELRIIDDGPGVPENEFEKITQPGHQGSTSVGGYGLGLAIVEDILEVQGGSLELKNNPDKGLTVAVKWNPPSSH